MSWRDNLLEASFRGVPFKVPGADTGVGRKNILHEFPFSDIPYLEDLGEDTPDYQVPGFIIQSIDNDFDYFPNRDALMKAVSTPGPGLLVHPSHGEIMVGVLGKVRFLEDFTNEGGIVRFNINFVLAGEKILPGPVVSPEAAMDAVVETSKESSVSDFLVNTSTEGEPGFSLLSLADNIKTSFKMIRSSVNSIKESIDSSISSALADLAELQSDIDSIIDSPADIANSIVASFNTFTSLVGIFGDTINPNRVSNNLKRTVSNAVLAVSRFGEILGSSDSPSSFGGQVEEISITTPIRARQSANQTSTIDYFRTLACITACQIAVRVEYDSSEDATSTLEAITTVIDSLLEKIGDETAGIAYGSYNIVFETSNLFTSLEELRREFTKIMVDLGASLADVKDYEVPATVESTLTLSYDEYKDISRADSIFDRNRSQVQHPGFLPENENIEILTS